MDKYLKLHALDIFFSEVIGLDIIKYHLGVHKILLSLCNAKRSTVLFLASSPSTPSQTDVLHSTGKDLQAEQGKEKLDQVSLSSFHPLQLLPSAVLYKTSTDLTNFNALIQKGM